MDNLTDLINKQSELLEKKYKSKLSINPDLCRALVSFQANKQEPHYRWFKYKEGFSSNLVKHILNKLDINSGTLFDPFAGSGTALFVASELNINSVGIDLLPISQEIIEVRKITQSNKKNKIIKTIQQWIKEKPWLKQEKKIAINHIRITEGAFSVETGDLIEHYLFCVSKNTDEDVQRVLKFVVLCILEEISYTRKDGQYLRWDYRSGRKQGKKPFNKGKIISFNDAIIKKLEQVLGDLTDTNKTLFENENKNRSGEVKFLLGSSLDLLPKLKANSFDCIFTSPPYCNRYDYTRTYALEDMLLGIDDIKIKELRQTMLSATVENKEKLQLKEKYSKQVFEKALKSFNSQKVLSAILTYLEDLKKQKILNNNGIVRMVRNYFFELSLIINECSRILKSGKPFIMVNDNVQYAGIEVPVDLILSDFASDAGFEVEKIWVLPIGKGNSSQQMGIHGRKPLRKCVYVWRKL